MAGGDSGIGSQVAGFTSDLFGWLRTDSRNALVAVGVAVACYFLVFGLRWLLVRLLGAAHPVTNWRGFARRIVNRTRSPFIAALSAYLVIHIVETPGLLSRAVDVVFVIAFAIQGALWMREVLLALVERHAADGDNAGEFDSAVNRPRPGRAGDLQRSGRGAVDPVRPAVQGGRHHSVRRSDRIG